MVLFQSNLTDGIPDSQIKNVIKMKNRGSLGTRWYPSHTPPAVGSSSSPEQPLGLQFPSPPTPAQACFGGGSLLRDRALEAKPGVCGGCSWFSKTGG